MFSFSFCELSVFHKAQMFCKVVIPFLLILCILYACGSQKKLGRLGSLLPPWVPGVTLRSSDLATAAVTHLTSPDVFPVDSL